MDVKEPMAFLLAVHQLNRFGQLAGLACPYLLSAVSRQRSAGNWMSFASFVVSLNCPSDSHPSGGSLVSQFEIRNSKLFLHALCSMPHASFLPLHLNIARKWASFGRTKN
jgi:hypothetical protein